MKKLIALALVAVVLVGGSVGCEKKHETPKGTGGGAGAGAGGTPSKSN